MVIGLNIVSIRDYARMHWTQHHEIDTGSG